MPKFYLIIKTSFFYYAWASLAVLFFPVLENCNAQSNTYCNTSLYSEVNNLYNEALVLVTNNKSGAIQLLKKATKADTTFAPAFYELGEIYHRKAILSQYDILYQSHTSYYFRKASDNFIYTIELCESINNYASYFYLGEQYFIQQEYSLAGYYLNLYLKNCIPTQPVYSMAENYYAKYLKWLWWKENPYNVSIYTTTICSEKDELSPFITSNAQYFYFMRKFDRYKPNSIYKESVSEIFLSNIAAIDSNQNWIFSEGMTLKWPFNGDIIYDKIAVNNENSEIFLTLKQQKKLNNKYIDIGTIYYTDNQNGYWEEPSKLDENINFENIFDGQPSISSDGKIMFFASNRPDGFGGTDIYYSIKDSLGNWGPAENIGDKINTVNDEITPFIHYDNKTLYFASNGHFGIGGFDFFVSRIDKEGNWEQPENMGRPINTPGNETGLVIDARGIKGYFASNSLAGFGGWDIYCVDIPKPFRPSEMIILNGKINAEDSLPITDFKIKIFNFNTNEQFKLITDIDQGTFSSIIPKKNNDYYIDVESDGYSFGNKIINGKHDSYTYFCDIELIKLKPGENFYLNHVYFNANGQLDNNSTKIVFDFVKYMNRNRTLKIRLVGIDPASNEIRNNDLLSKKAELLYHELIHMGISKSRLEFKSDSLLISNLPLVNTTKSEILIDIIDY